MNNKKSPIYEFGQFRLNQAEGQLLRNGEVVQITPKAFETLVLFVERAGKLIEKEELLQTLWPDTFVEEANLTHHVWRLRKTLEESKDGEKYIETIPKRGYRFVGVVTIPDDYCSEAAGQEQNLSEVVTLSDHNSNLTSPPDTHFEIPSAIFEPGVIEKVDRKRLLYLGLVCILFLGAASALAYFRIVRNRPNQSVQDGNTSHKSLAVLPFKPLNPENSDASLEFGITDALITRLSNLKDISVRPTRSVLKYSSDTLDLPAAGRALKVESVLDGRVQHLGDRVRITVQLIRSEDGKTLWAETFDEKFTDIFTLEDSLSAKLARTLALKLTGTDAMHLTRHYTDNLEAYQSFQLARYQMNKVGITGLTKAIAAFEQATAKDPGFALAYAGLADAHTALAFSSLGSATPEGEFNKAKAAASKALEIDEGLAEVHSALGNIALQYDWDWPTAEKELKRAVELNPNLAEAHHVYSEYLQAMGRFDDGLREIVLAQALDPLSQIINFHHGLCLFGAGREDEAIGQFKKTLELEPNSPAAHWGLGAVYERQKKYDAAISEFELVLKLDSRPSFRLANLARTYALAGKRGKAEELLNQLLTIRKDGFVSSASLAGVYSALGDDDLVFENLERAYADKESLMPFVRLLGWSPSVLKDPRYQELIGRMKFPSYQ